MAEPASLVVEVSVLESRIVVADDRCCDDECDEYESGLVHEP